jgi:hypothetical protein
MVELSGRTLSISSGIKACMHPHVNPHLFAEEEIGLFVENTDPAWVYLCIGTAHAPLFATGSWLRGLQGLRDGACSGGV